MLMPLPHFTPSHAVSFDSERGRVSVGGAEQVLVPAGVLVSALQTVEPAVLRDLGRSMGTEMGRRVASRFAVTGSAVEEASPEILLEHLGGELALHGLGALSLETWGRALVFMLEHAPGGPGTEELAAAAVEGFLLRVFGKSTELVRLSREPGRTRFLTVSPSTAERVRAWLGAGTGWGEALARLEQRVGEDLS